MWCGVGYLVSWRVGETWVERWEKISIDIGIEGAKWVCKSVGQQEWSVVILGAALFFLELE